MYSGANLAVYPVDLHIALEMELRRFGDPGRGSAADLADAVCFLKHITSYGAKPLGFHQCQSLDFKGRKLPVPTEAIRELQKDFEDNKESDPRVEGKQGIVDMVWDKAHNRWYYRNRQGEQVPVTWKLE